MLAGVPARSDFIKKCAAYDVEDMSDGAMGSIRFLSPPGIERHFGEVIARAEYLDQDGILVSISINSDQLGEPYELDFWKVDFSPLGRYPEPSQLRIT
jgi:hypothetical protein